MKISCPNCKQSIELDDGKNPAAPGVLKQGCPACQTSLQVEFIVKLIEKSSEQHAATTPLSQKILVAVDGEASRELIQEMLTHNHYRVLTTADGETALSMVKQYRPDIAILDIGLPKLFGFEVCEAIKKNKNLKDTQVILLAATANKEIYRRKPKTLHGAQDYIETHRVEKELLSKIKLLINSTQAPTADHVETSQEIPETQGQTPNSLEDEILSKTDIGENLISAVQENMKNTVEAPEQEEARRLARIIVSDIALYNAPKVKEAIEKNSFYEIFKKDIEEGRKLIQERITPEIRGQIDFIQEAMDDFIQRQH